LQELVVSGCDAAELFELVEEALDAISFLVQIGVVGALDLAVAFGWDDDLGSLFLHLFNEMIGIVTLVGQKGLGIDPLDEIVGLGDVVALAGRSDQPQRQAEGVGGNMDLGGQSTPRPTQALGIRPPFSLRAPAAWLWARTMVESTISHSRSASRARTASMSSSTPISIQR